jgi:lipoate-protein ligase A
MKSWDLLIDPVPRSGAANMAVDEFLFRRLTAEPGTAVRFYDWSRPTASLGYSQCADKVLNVNFCRRNGVDVVRRLTGGKLVLHWREITYSVVSSDIGVFSETVSGSYRFISEALIRGLAKMGLKARLAGPPPSSYSRGNMPCFAYPSRDEIEVDGRKIIGSAQKRVAGRFLQHGSIPLQDDEGLLQRVSLAGDEVSGLRRVSVREALGRDFEREWAVDCLVKGMAEYFGVRFVPLVLGPAEERGIRLIQERRYEDEDWTLAGPTARSIDFADVE